MKKYYAVREGKVPGIYETWAECEEQVKGYSGAEFKSFQNREDAKDYILRDNKEAISNCEAVAYTDGSFNINNSHFSYGVVLFYNEEKITFSEDLNYPEMASMRNVAGEITGAVRAMQFCVKNNIKTLEIRYDYEGVEKWCTGVWKTNKPGTIRYKEYYDSIKELLSVTFTKVKGHSGNKYNDEADLLAKKALGLA